MFTPEQALSQGLGPRLLTWIPAALENLYGPGIQVAASVRDLREERKSP